MRWLSGEENIRSFKVPDAQRFTNSFCSVCGGRVPRQAAGGDVVMIPAGSLDDEPAIRPQARIFQGSRAPWSCAGDELPVHAEYAPS